MSTRLDDAGLDDAGLDRWLADVRETIDGQIARERRELAGDFCAVIEAAHARGLVDAVARDEAGQLAPIVSLALDSHADHDPLGLDADIDAMIADARSHAEADVAARRLAGIPPVAMPGLAVEPARREIPFWLIAVGLAAVIAGLVIAVPRLLESFVDGNYREALPQPTQAEYLHERDEPERELQRPPSLLAPEPAPHQAVVHEPRRPQPRARASSESSAELGDRVAKLEAQARAAWQAGELARAEATYREILVIAGRTRYADLAYGDLFTLAHQRGDAAAELALWRDYLRQFPRGRFAEDAWAGSCRRSSASERAACWQGYLEQFPNGVHAATAARALEPTP
jgi:hypothetical protein